MTFISIWEILVYKEGSWKRIGMLALDSYPHTSNHAAKEAARLANRFGIFEEIYSYPYTASKVRAFKRDPNGQGKSVNVDPRPHR